MNRIFQIGDKAVYIPTDEIVKVVNIDLSHNHIEVEFDDGAETVLELQSLRPIDKFNIGDDVIITSNDFVFHNMKAKIITKGDKRGKFIFYEVTTDGKDRHRFDESELKLNIQNSDNGIEEEIQETSLDELVNIFYKHYENKDGTFTIPREVLLNLIDLIIEVK